MTLFSSRQKKHSQIKRRSLVALMLLCLLSLSSGLLANETYYTTDDNENNAGGNVADGDLDILNAGQSNAVATLQYSRRHGYSVNSISANKLRDQFGEIHPRCLHPTMYDPHRMQPSEFGEEYLQSIFTDAIGWDDMEQLKGELFQPGNLATRFQSVNADISKRVRHL